jgi:phosphotransferase system  glucose/maltose/N-acetylglucosamine-specific IIC component
MASPVQVNIVACSLLLLIGSVVFVIWPPAGAALMAYAAFRLAVYPARVRTHQRSPR